MTVIGFTLWFSDGRVDLVAVKIMSDLTVGATAGVALEQDFLRRKPPKIRPSVLVCGPNAVCCQKIRFLSLG